MAKQDDNDNADYLNLNEDIQVPTLMATTPTGAGAGAGAGTRLWLRFLSQFCIPNYRCIS